MHERTPRTGVCLLILAALTHVWIVGSVARQPLAVERAPAAKRSVVWPLYHDTVHRPGPFADFFAVYHAGVAVRQGTDPYDPEEARPITPYQFPFRYLPAIGETFGRLLSALPPVAAARVWIAVLEILLGGILLLLWRSLRPAGARVFAVSLLLLSTPYFLELHMGQFTFAALVAAGAALWLLRTGPGRTEGEDGRVRVGAAAVLFSAAVLLKGFPLVVAPALLRRGRSGWSCLGLALLALLLLNAPYFASHPQALRAYLGANLGTESLRHGLDGGNVGTLYLAARSLGEAGLHWNLPAWLAFARIWRWAVLGTTALLVLAARRPDPLRDGAALLLAHFAAYHQVWEHHLSGLLPLALLLLADALSRARRRPATAEGKEMQNGPSEVEEDRPVWTAERDILLIALAAILLAAPSPFLLFDRALDPTVADAAASWSLAGRILIPASRSVPVVLLLGLAWIRLSRPLVAAIRGSRAGA